MHLTRTGYNFFVAIWLAPLILFDFVGNSISTGTASDFYYYKFMADCLILAYALWQMFGRAATTSASNAQARANDHSDEVIGFEKLGAAEYLYCAILVVYAAANWFQLHLINKESTGAISVATLVWSFVSLLVAVLSAIQFYHLKSGVIVELKHKVVQ